MRARRYPAASALDRSTSNSTPTSSRSLSAPKKPVYGLIPNADWTTVAVPRYRPEPGVVTCSRAGCVLPFRVTGAFDRAAAGPGGNDPGRGEGCGGPAQDVLHLLLDLGAVPVGERLDPARPLADLQRAEVEFGGDRGGGHAAVFVGRHLDPRRPPGYLDGEVMAGLRGQPGPARLDDDASRVRPEPEIACVCSHGPNRKGSGGKRSTASSDAATYVANVRPAGDMRLLQDREQ